MSAGPRPVKRVPMMMHTKAGPHAAAHYGRLEPHAAEALSTMTHARRAHEVVAPVLPTTTVPEPVQLYCAGTMRYFVSKPVTSFSWIVVAHTR